MKDPLSITWLVLVALTIATPFLAQMDLKAGVAIILGVAFLKFLGVAFYFMELRKAHSFWKVVLVAFLMIFMVTILLI